MNEWSVGLDLEIPTGYGYNVSKIDAFRAADSLEGEIDSKQV